MTFAHEYDHALQDQNFDRSSPTGGCSSTRATAARAAGRCTRATRTLLMTQWAHQQPDPGGDPGDPRRRQRSGADGGAGERIPPILRETLAVPVHDRPRCSSRASRARAAGRRSMRCTTGCPTSTEQILHPEKYARQRGADRRRPARRPRRRAGRRLVGRRSRTRSASSRSAIWLREAGVEPAPTPATPRPAGAAIGWRSSTARTTRGPSSCRPSGTRTPTRPRSRQPPGPPSRRPAARRRSCPARAARPAGSWSPDDDATLGTVASALGLRAAERPAAAPRRLHRLGRGDPQQARARWRG